jgi:hypothetical protein
VVTTARSSHSICSPEQQLGLSHTETNSIWSSPCQDRSCPHTLRAAMLSGMMPAQHRLYRIEDKPPEMQIRQLD